MPVDEVLIALLKCPECGGGVVVGKDEARVECKQGGHSFPIIGGIPRFAEKAYVASFGRQWNRYEVARNAEDETVFKIKTGLDPSDLEGLRVLDAGCGGGRYAQLTAKAGASLIAVDLSDAVEMAAKLCSGFSNALIVQADLLALPLANDAFDFAFSIGVLHHSPNPREAFAQVAQRIRPGGRLAVWLYRKNTYPQEILNRILRSVSTRIPEPWLEKLCAVLGLLGSIPFLNRTLNKVFNFSNHPDWTLRVCDNFDWYAPRYQSHHTIDELWSWFAEEGFENIEVLSPVRTGRLYDWAYRNNLVIGSGVNIVGTRKL